MKIYHCCLPAFACLLLVSCSPYANYFMSPSEVRANPYVTLPMAVDSQKILTMASLGFQGGGSNDGLRDGLIGGSTSIMQSHQFGHFQGYYGAVLAMGNYNYVSDTYEQRYGPSFDSTWIHVPGGNHFFGHYGFNGGMNWVIPFPSGRGEWRALGVDAGYRKEFGDYLSFRKGLNPDDVQLNALYNHIFTIGGSTEILGRSRRGVQVSYKFAAGAVIYPRGQYVGYTDGNKPFYLSHTVALTKNNVTGYFQITSGVRAFAIQTGVNINLRHRKGGFPDFGRPARERKPGRRHPHPPNPFHPHRQFESDR